MRLHMTNGKDSFEFIIDPVTDARDYRAVITAKMPVSKALDVIKARIGAETFAGLYPIQGQALTGLPQ